MAITFNSPKAALNLYASSSDADSAAYDDTGTRGLTVCDAWAQVIGAASSANAHTVQLQTAAGAANVTGTMTFNGLARGTLVRTTTLLSANGTFATGGTLRYNVVRVVGGPNGVAVNAVCVPA